MKFELDGRRRDGLYKCIDRFTLVSMKANRAEWIAWPTRDMCHVRRVLVAVTATEKDLFFGIFMKVSCAHVISTVTLVED